MSDSDISALRDEIRSLNTNLTRLGEKVSDMDPRLWSIKGWLTFFGSSSSQSA